MEKQTVLILETVLISIWLWKCPSYSTYIRDVFENIETVPILETVLILEMKEYRHFPCLKNERPNLQTFWNAIGHLILQY